MSRRKRLLWIVAVGLVALIVAALLGVYFALRHEPAFYREAMETKPDVLEKASDRMLKKIGALQSAMNRSGPLAGRHHRRGDQRLAGGRSAQEPSERPAAVGQQIRGWRSSRTR